MKNIKYIVITLLVIAAAIIALFGFFYYKSTHQKSELEIRQDYSVEYSMRTQRENNVECDKLRDNLNELIADIHKDVIYKRKSGENWLPYVSDKIKTMIYKIDHDVLICQQLYVGGNYGKYNRLEYLSFINNVNDGFINIRTLLNYGAGSNCDEICANKKFINLESSLNEVALHVK